MSDEQQGGRDAPDESSEGERGNRLYTRVVYARVSEAEWRAIRRRAQDSDFSMSRYLVRAALLREPPPSREERARLEDLLYRLRRAAIRLRQLSGLRWVQTADPETSEIVREAVALLEGLIREMTRRVYGRGA